MIKMKTFHRSKSLEASLIFVSSDWGFGFNLAKFLRSFVFNLTVGPLRLCLWFGENGREETKTKGAVV